MNAIEKGIALALEAQRMAVNPAFRGTVTNPKKDRSLRGKARRKARQGR